MTEFSRDLPIGYLARRPAPVQPDHPDELSRLGVGGVYGHRHEVRYSGGALVQVIRPEGDCGDPRGALAFEMYRIAVSRHQPFSEALEACAAERYPDNHEFEPAVLRVNGVDWAAVEVREYGFVARAAVVNGWTVVAAVSEGSELAVELHTVAELAAA